MDISNIKSNLVSEIEKLVEIIKNEYPNLVDIPDDCDFSKRVHIENTGTISLFVNNKHFYFPLDAFKILETLKKLPGFGMMKNHETCTEDNMIINNNTYITYMKHVFLKGLTPEEYFKEILLHETLHFCGSGGETAIREGINELKTRQLAKKYGLLTSACGYPKETKIAYELEKIFGEDVINEIAFSKSDLEIEKILNSVSLDAASFFFDLKRLMNEEFYDKYMRYDFPGITGPLKKTQKYNSVDYTKAYALIEDYKKRHKISKSISADVLKDEHSKQKILENKKTINEKQVEQQVVNKQNALNVSREIFDQRSESEIKVAEQIRIKNQMIAQQRKADNSKALTRVNSGGHADIIVFSLIISFIMVVLLMLIYFILK